MSDADSEDLPEPLEPVAPEDTVSQVAGYLMNRLFAVGRSLDSARGIVGDGPASDRIAAATDEVNRLIRDIQTATFDHVGDRSAALRERLVHTAHALQLRALDAVALLQREASRERPPGRLDYPTEIKRWTAFADHADQMARHWERPPRAEVPELTPREREVLNLLADGQLPKELAQDLDISINTCRAHIRAILHKLDVHSELAAVVRAARLGLLTEP